ncbi:hypothetical protein DH2020_049174 [Rehmannia glutinosa]|uniref:Uncharacterized protein n=1 Tax=Rehmannia glutinosa TaxID=99300 RepID=A0ABR0U3S0_REHGL
MDHLQNLASTSSPRVKIGRDDFAKDFVFGIATSAYQVEGAASEGGRGPSIWDAWTLNHPSRILDHTNGNVAIDQYHKYKEDVKQMKKTGFDAYRFSISWPRILPCIEPYITLFHWDLPLTLELEYGGFLSENIVKDYCEYVELCFWEFGDRAYQGGNIGITVNSTFFEPLNDTKEDREAARRAADFRLGWFVAPLATGEYPQSMRDAVGDRLPKFTQEQTKLIKDSYDFLGLNYYTANYAINTPKPSGQKPNYTTDQEVTFTTERDNVPIGPKAATDWLFIVPKGIYGLLVHLKEIYKIRLIYITENGVNEANDSSLTISEARNDQAYFVWSFADSFEWVSGYTVRFGIFYTDYMDGRLTRYPKRSAIWWANFLNKKLIIKSSLKRPAQYLDDENDPEKKAKN